MKFTLLREGELYSPEAQGISFLLLAGSQRIVVTPTAGRK